MADGAAIASSTVPRKPVLPDERLGHHVIPEQNTDRHPPIQNLVAPYDSLNQKLL